MRVLITGVCGFAGSHLAEYTLAQGVEVAGIDVDEAFPAGVSAYPGDVTQPAVVERAVQRVRPDRVFHLAALVPTGDVRVSSDRLITVNVLGTLRVLEAVRLHAPTAYTLVVSSASIYGAVPPDRQPIDESTPFRPSTPYAASKAMQELLAIQYGAEHGLPVMRARTFNQTGPRETAGLVTATLARQVAEIEAGIRGSELSVRYLDTRRDFTDVRDVVRAYWLILERGVAGDAYNVCSGRAHSVADVLQMLLTLADLTEVQVVEREPHRLPGDAALSLGDPSRLTTATGWQPKIPFEQSLRDLLDQYRAHTRAGMK